MIKKITLTLLAAATVTGLSAKEISADEALARAAANTPAGAMKAPAAASMTLRSTLKANTGANAIFIFEGDGQGLVLPADDRADAVLGYFDAAPDGQIPPQMQWWLQGYADQIGYMLANPETSSTSPALTIASPAKAAPMAKDPIAPMLTTTWSQEAPYNALCPTVSGSRAVTGCVATAAAQVMKYFNYPDKGTGTVSYKDNGVTRTLNLANKSFDWKNMLNSYAGTYSTTQKNAVAYLMQAVGYVSEMEYSSEASGAQSPTMLEGLKKYLNYNSKATFLSREFFGLTEWEDLVYSNLKNVGPVYYDGTDNLQGGHAFVCDGYSSDGYFHFNWGWAGSYDGYFKLTALVPEGQGTGGNVGGFNFDQGAVFNLTTPTGTTIDLPARAPLTLVGNLTATLFDSTTLSFTSDMADYMGVFFYNYTGATVSLDFGVKAVNQATGATAYQEYGEYNPFAMFEGLDELILEIPDGLANGTYRMYPVCRTEDGDWMEFCHAVWSPNYITANVTNGRMSSIANVTGGTISATDLVVESPKIYMGYATKLSYTVSNDSEFEVYDGIYPMIFTISGGSAVPASIGDFAAYDLLPGESREITIDVPMYIYEGKESLTGNAYLGLVSNNQGEILEYVPVKILAAPGNLSAKSNGFTYVGNRNAANANNLEFSCSLGVTAGYWADPLSVYICSRSTYEVLTILASEQYYYLSKNESATATVKGAFPEAVAGTSYNAIFGYVDPQSYSVKTLASMTIKVTTEYSGVEEIAADGDAEVTLSADRNIGKLTVTAPREIASVIFYTIDGRMAAANVTIDGNIAAAGLDKLPDGVSIVSVTLADGSVKVAKFVK